LTRYSHRGKSRFGLLPIGPVQLGPFVCNIVQSGLHRIGARQISAKFAHRSPFQSSAFRKRAFRILSLEAEKLISLPLSN
jgi:hypothetical protein